MDQLKDILKQAIKYRFWIAVGLSALLPMIAYFLGAPAISKKATDEAKKIDAADKTVKQYASGTIPNAQYKPIVAEKTEDLTKDVNATWKKLYARQAPLLTWPERVQDRFMTWGRKWPENVDSSAVQNAIIDYVTVYPKFVTQVYQTFKPFDPMEGTGVVSAPPEAALLRPANFTIESPPPLGKVWAAQERLWIQRTLLDVVAQVNKDASDWDRAIIKQINLMEVGNQTAQDQRSIAKGDTLEEAAKIDDPAKPAEEAPAEEVATGPAAGMKGMREMMGGAMMGGAALGPAESVFYIKNESTQYKVLPVQMSVLIEQDRIQDFLIALENSPMTIEVKDFEMTKPESRVTKPEKGVGMSFAGYGGMMAGMKGMMGEGMMPGGMGAYGGAMARQMMMGGMGRAGDMGGMSMMPGMMGGMMGGNTPVRKGVDARGKNRASEAAKVLKGVKNVTQSSTHDPYYHIVDVKIYGQARFFNPPPAETPAEPSQAEGATPPADGAAAPAAADAEKKAEQPKADAEKKAVDVKPEAEKKADEPKAEPEKKADAPKAEPEKKADAPKAEAPK